MPYCKDAFLSGKQRSAVDTGSEKRKITRKKIFILFYPVIHLSWVCSLLVCLCLLFFKFIT